MGWPLAMRPRRARAGESGGRLWGEEWVSRVVCYWQAIRRVGGPSPMAGEEWRERGARAPLRAN